MLTGNAAAAWGARLADVDYVPAFPITPQTEIIETLARWCHTGETATKLVLMDSEHSMLAAAAGAAAAGIRVFTATSSQGFVYGFEMLYAIAALGCRSFWSMSREPWLIRLPWNRTTMTFYPRGIPVFSSFTPRPLRRFWTRFSSLTKLRSSRRFFYPPLSILMFLSLLYARTGLYTGTRRGAKIPACLRRGVSGSIRQAIGRARRHRARLQLVQLFQTPNASRSRNALALYPQVADEFACDSAGAMKLSTSS